MFCILRLYKPILAWRGEGNILKLPTKLIYSSSEFKANSFFCKQNYHLLGAGKIVYAIAPLGGISESEWGLKPEHHHVRLQDQREKVHATEAGWGVGRTLRTLMEELVLGQ